MARHPYPIFGGGVLLLGCFLLSGCDRPTARAKGVSGRGKTDGQSSSRKGPSSPEWRLLPPPLPDPETTLLEPFDPKKTMHVELARGVSMELVRVPPGRFRLGDVRLGNRVVVTRPFYIGRHEVTQEQWQALMEKNPSRIALGAKHPVERVDWDDVQQFLQRLNTRCGQPGLKFALPTESQWEYAARAGSSAQVLNNADPDFVHSYGWIGANAAQTTHPVGQRKPNAWGLYDMQGNVAEWCADATEADDPQAAFERDARPEFHAVRGGNWREGPADCLPSSRQVRRAMVPLRFDGFRVIAVKERE